MNTAASQNVEFTYTGFKNSLQSSKKTLSVYEIAFYPESQINPIEQILLKKLTISLSNFAPVTEPKCPSSCSHKPDYL